MTKNVECPYCHVREDRQVVETGQVSVGKPMQMYKFKCDDVPLTMKDIEAYRNA